jgi:hypothetical protein
MARFSASDAAIAGFRLAGEQWRAVLGWLLFNLLLAVGMIVATVIVLLGLIAVSGPGAEETTAAIGAAVAALGALVSASIIVGGVFRVMLRPEQPAFLYLRLGLGELKLVALWLLTLGVGLVLVGGAVAVAGLAAPRGGWIGILANLIAAAFAVWLLLRFSLAGPAAFTGRGLGLSASWRLTRGRALPLFGMSAMTGCLLALVWLTASLALVVMTGALTGFHDFADLIGEASFEAHPGRFLIQGAAQAVLAPLLLILGQAPLAAAYAALSEPTPD